MRVVDTLSLPDLVAFLTLLDERGGRFRQEPERPVQHLVVLVLSRPHPLAFLVTAHGLPPPRNRPGIAPGASPHSSLPPPRAQPRGSR
jgi:hypothetical protein